MREYKLREMIPGVPYVVVNGKTGTLQAGDHISLEGVDRSILCKEAGGWLKQENWRRLRTCVRFDFDTVRKKIKYHQDEIEYWENIYKSFSK